MKKLLFKLIMSVLFAGVLLGSKDAKSQTAGVMTFSVNLTPHNGQYSTNNNNGQNHYTVIWVQTASGNFVKTLYRDQLAPGKDVWEHCQVWVASNTTLPYGNAVDAVTSATLTSYAAPVTATWNGSDTTNPSPFKLLPDGNYRLFIETAWTATYIMYAGRDTASFAFTKGPSVATTTFPSVTNFSGASVTWTPTAITNTVTTSAVDPTTYAAGASVSVPFTLAGAATLYANNIWTAQLSDAAGSFTNPVAIGTVATPTVAGTGTVSATIPSGTPNGTGYRIRVVGTAPGTIGTDNGSNITITNGISPALTAATGATVDNPFIVTFTDDATWRAAVTAIKIGGTTLTAGSAITAGQITFTPSASIPANLLHLAGT